MDRHTLKPAFVLHRRKYREKSAMVDLLIEDLGVCRGILRGAYQSKSSKSADIEPFSPVLVAGRFDNDKLATIAHIEKIANLSLNLSRNALACGFYLNELTLKFKAHAASAALFGSYRKALADLSMNDRSFGAILREYEFHLLVPTGVSIESVASGKSQFYFQPEQGIFTEVGENGVPVTELVAEIWLNEAWDRAANSKALKEFHQQLIQYYIGNVQFKSRSLFESKVRD